MKQLGEAVKAIQIDKNFRKVIYDTIVEINKQEQDFQTANLERLNREAKKVRKEIHMIYQDKLDGNLSTEQWQEENDLRQWRLIGIKNRIEAFDETNKRFMDEVNSTLELLEDLYSKYLQVSDEMKVKLLKTLLSNCTLKDGKVSYTYKKPFCYIAETDCFEKIYPRCDSNAWPTA